VSLRDLAAAADCTTGALFGHFRTKGQLLVEVIRSKLAERDAANDYVAAAEDAERGVDLIYDVGGRELRLLEIDASAAARHDPDVAAGLAWIYRERFERVRDVMDGVMRDGDAAAWLVATVSAGIGAHESAGLPLLESERMRATILAALRGLAEEGTTVNRGTTT
jgi:AcrR family transcriptional regulator